MLEGPFYDLLQLIIDEHERELSELKTQNQQLNQKLQEMDFVFRSNMSTPRFPDVNTGRCIGQSSDMCSSSNVTSGDAFTRIEVLTKLSKARRQSLPPRLSQDALPSVPSCLVQNCLQQTPLLVPSSCVHPNQVQRAEFSVSSCLLPGKPQMEPSSMSPSCLLAKQLEVPNAPQRSPSSSSCVPPSQLQGSASSVSSCVSTTSQRRMSAVSSSCILPNLLQNAPYQSPSDKRSQKIPRSQTSESFFSESGIVATMGAAVMEKEKNARQGPALFALQKDALQKTCFKAWHRHVKSNAAAVSFEPHPQIAAFEGCRSYDARKLQSVRQPENEWFGDHHQEQIERGSGLCSLVLISPGSSQRIAWDLVGTCLLAYDIVMIPLSSFGPERNFFTVAMEWSTLLFWSADIIMSCLTGVTVKGAIVMEPMEIIKSYLKTWFVLDMMVIVPDWIFKVMSIARGSRGNGNAANSGKLLRTFRLLRTVRLLRLAKLQRIMILARDRIDSEVTFIIINIVKLISILLMLNHCLAAVWWSLGSFARDANGPNWIDSQSLANEGFSYRYLTALHWSVCMFTPGSMSVQPQNAWERGFAILVLLFGMVVFTSFMSSMTAAVLQLKSMRGDRGKNVWMLRRFLHQNCIGPELSFRVLRYVDNVFQEQKTRKISSDRVWALQLLTEQLRAEVKYEASYSCLHAHPLMERLKSQSKVSMLRLVGTAFSQQILATTDILFEIGGSATHMHVVVSGELLYIKANDIGCERYENKAVHGDWFCEPVLWTPWTHLGFAKAVLESELVSVEYEHFLDMLRMEAHTWSQVCCFGQRCVVHLSAIPFGRLSDLGKSDFARSFAAGILEEVDDLALECSSDGQGSAQGSCKTRHSRGSFTLEGSTSKSSWTPFRRSWRVHAVT